jgi:hypothetical protein
MKATIEKSLDAPCGSEGGDLEPVIYVSVDEYGIVAKISEQATDYERLLHEVRLPSPVVSSQMVEQYRARDMADGFAESVACDGQAEPRVTKAR